MFHPSGYSASTLPLHFFDDLDVPLRAVTDLIDLSAPLDCMSRNEASKVTSECRSSVRLGRCVACFDRIRASTR